MQIWFTTLDLVALEVKFNLLLKTELVDQETMVNHKGKTTLFYVTFSNSWFVLTVGAGWCGNRLIVCLGALSLDQSGNQYPPLELFVNMAPNGDNPVQWHSPFAEPNQCSSRTSGRRLTMLEQSVK